MLEEPEFDRGLLLACLLDSFGVVVDRLDFLPLRSLKSSFEPNEIVDLARWADRSRR